MVHYTGGIVSLNDKHVLSGMSPLTDIRQSVTLLTDTIYNLPADYYTARSLDVTTVSRHLAIPH
jgi:hypothetical protein